MLYFSETVCVLTLSSSLPVTDGARESSKCDIKGFLACPSSESKLPLRDDIAEVTLEDKAEGTSE